jgi:hypothetical protein
VDSRLGTLLDFVRWHRPHWLRYTPADGWTHEGVAVYLNGAWIGGDESLGEIAAGFAASLRYIDGDEASARWGRGHEAGAILITSMPALLAAGRDGGRPPSG